MIGFENIVAYLAWMYFFINYITIQQLLIVPLLLRNFGYVVVAAVLLTYLTRIPFPHFFQSLTIQAFLSTASGTSIGGAIIHHLFSHTATKNFQLLLAGMLQTQVLMIGFRLHARI